MKSSTLIAVVVFAALAAGVFMMSRRAPERGISRISYAQVKPDDVDRLEVSGPNPVELRRDGGVWKLKDGKEADASAVSRALDGLPKIVSSDLITNASERFAELEVDDEKGTRVKAFRGTQELADVVLGKNVSGGAAVRVGGDVYTVKGIFPGLFSKPAASWTERRFFKRPVSDVTRLDVKVVGETPYVVVKGDDGKWKLEDESVLPAGMRFDPSAAMSLVNSAAGLRAKEVVDPDPGAAITKLGEGDVLTLGFKAFEGKPADPTNPSSKAEEARPAESLSLRLGAPRDSDQSVFAQVEGRSVLYVVPDNTAKSLRKKLTELRDTSVMAFDAAKAQQLTLIEGKNKTVFAKKEGAWALVSTTDKKPDDFVLDAGAVERRVGSIATSKAVSVVEGATPAQTGLANPSARVIVKLEGGKDATLLFGNTTKVDDREIIYVRGNATDFVWTAMPYMKQNLTSGLASFKKQEAAPDAISNLDPAQLQGLPPDVRESLMKQVEQKRREQEMLQRIQTKQAP